MLVPTVFEAPAHIDPKTHDKNRPTEQDVIPHADHFCTHLHVAGGGLQQYRRKYQRGQGQQEQ